MSTEKKKPSAEEIRKNKITKVSAAIKDEFENIEPSSLMAIANYLVDHKPTSGESIGKTIDAKLATARGTSKEPTDNYTEVVRAVSTGDGLKSTDKEPINMDTVGKKFGDRLTHNSKRNKSDIDAVIKVLVALRKSLPKPPPSERQVFADEVKAKNPKISAEDLKTQVDAEMEKRKNEREAKRETEKKQKEAEKAKKEAEKQTANASDNSQSE